MRVLRYCVLFLALGAWSFTAQAAGDAEAGKKLSSQCMGCHGIPRYVNAYPTYYVPKLWGQHEAYLLAALQGYRDGSRMHPTMQGMASSLTNQEMADLAAFFATR